jgi:Flp pilus assembly protein TadG
MAMPGQRHRSRARRRQSGAAAVEFGLIVLPLFLILFGIIQYGFYFWSMQAGSAAARDAARQAAVGKLTCSALQTYVTDRLGPTRDSSKAVTVERIFTPSTPTIGGNVEIQVTFNSYSIAPGLIPTPGGDADVTQTAESRVENVVTGSGGDLPC